MTLYVWILIMTLLAACRLQCAYTGESTEKQVLAMKPVGYWPVDEGKGSIVYDLTGNNNHGAILSVEWHDGFLVFDNDFYQWIEVPYKKTFGSTSFSMGGWIYSAIDTNPQYECRVGAILIGQPFVSARKNPDSTQLKWGAIWEDRLDIEGAVLRYFVPPKNETSIYLEVGSGRQNDALGTLKEEVSIPHSTWQHVIYSYDGNARQGILYVNGKLVREVDNIPYKSDTTPLVIGAGRWGTSNLGGNMSMDGTLREMVFFDRNLEAEEVQKLYKITKPSSNPKITLYSERYSQRDSEYQKVVAAKEITIHGEGHNLNQLISYVQDVTLDDFSRGKAAIELAAMGEKSKSAITALAAELKRMDADDPHLPKVEEFFRNALIRGLLDIDRDVPVAKEALADAFVEPFFNCIDTSGSCFDPIRPLIKSGKWFEALEAYKTHTKALPKVQKRREWGTFTKMEEIDALSRIFPLSDEYFNGYMSGGVPYLDAGYSAYSLVENMRDGTSYTTLTERVPFDEVLRVFDKELKAYSDKRPEQTVTSRKNQSAREWNRLKIIKIKPDGERQVVYLHGDWFIFDCHDAKMYGWSIITDEKGYIHLFGGQHNNPNQDNYIPGSWERLGIAVKKSRPSVMYWVSKRPNDITEFEFVGQQSSPRKTIGKLNYMNFARCRDGKIFLYGRGDAWTWCLHQYDAVKQRWKVIRGSVMDMMQHAEKVNPDWVKRLAKTTPYFGPEDGLVVSWQPGAYNFCRTWSKLTGDDIRGIMFDPSGRMHVSLALIGVLENANVTHRPVYAYSDDNGDSFYSADGKRLTLPLTHNPIPGHNADRSLEPARSHFEAWISLVRELK